KPEVTNFTGDHETLQLLASAEKGSEHPLAEAIVAYAAEQDLKPVDVDDFEAIPGHGIRDVTDGQHVLVGTRKLMTENNIDINDAKQELVEIKINVKTTMLIAINKEYQFIDPVSETD